MAVSFNIAKNYHVGASAALFAAAICLTVAAPVAAQDLWPTVPYETTAKLKGQTHVQ
jgi:hypothetical protein